MGKNIMLQGTASNVGKSLLTAALCRILMQDGMKVIPFKSQNMALNSYITEEGLEMGRAQVFQAEAAGLKPSVIMNPILLKPSSDKRSQVIINGKVYGNMSAREYHEFKPQLLGMLTEHYEKISSEYDVVVIEGAGSPAEINLRDKDIVNMGMAEVADAPVILIGDIDKGGVFASLVGTMMLLREEEKKRVKGVIINKFRGDKTILDPGIKMLEELMGVPVLGVIPYTYLQLEDEDSLTTRFKKRTRKQNIKKPEGKEQDSRVKNEEAYEASDGMIEVAIIWLPHLSNFTDFNRLELEEDVNLRYVRRGEHIGKADLVILPGSKNTLEDLKYLKESGLDMELYQLKEEGTLIMGICGGYQMLGHKICDPEGVEGKISEAYGLGLINRATTFKGDKVTTQVEGVLETGLPGVLEACGGIQVKGYEIHMGISEKTGDCYDLLTIEERLGEKVSDLEGSCNEEGTVFGTYLHGIFDEGPFARCLLNAIRKQKGLGPLESEVSSFQAFKQGEYDKLAEVVRENLDMEAIYKILEESMR